MDVLCFAVGKLSKLEMFFQKQGFLTWMKWKTDLADSNNPNWENLEKNCSETWRRMIKTEKSYLSV